MEDDARCAHWNETYGRCTLPQGHVFYYNGAGVFYKHLYVMQGSFGNLDVLEAVESIGKVGVPVG